MAGLSCSCPCQEVWCGLQDVESFKNRFDEFCHSPRAALVPGAGGCTLDLSPPPPWLELWGFDAKQVYSLEHGGWSILDTWSFIHRTLHNRSPHLSIHSKYRLSQHQKWFSSYSKDIDIFNPNEMISPWRWDDEEKSVLSVSMPVVWIY